MRSLVLVAIAAATVSTPAMAQDVLPFSGLRVEGVAGWDHLSDSGPGDGSSNGLMYGGAIGFDARVNRAVIGAEVELTGSTTDTNVVSRLALNDRFSINAGRDVYVGGRIGALVTPVALIYAKAGYSNARMNVDYRVGNTFTSFNRNLDGLRLGVGGEYQLSGNMYAKGEYRYTNYNSIAGYRTDLDRHQVLGGVGIRF